MQADAVGSLYKDVDSQTLTYAVRSVHDGRFTFVAQAAVAMVHPVPIAPAPPTS